MIYSTRRAIHTLFLTLLITVFSPVLMLAQNLSWESFSVPGHASEVAVLEVGGDGSLYAIGHDNQSLGILGIYKSTDFGANWDYLSPDPQPGTSSSYWDLDVDANGVIYHTDRNILKSEDDGATWQELDTGGGLFDSDVELEIDSNQRIYVRRNGDNGIILSEDGGSSWTSVLSPSDNIDDIYIDGNDNVYAIGSFGVQMTEDQGANWATIFDSDTELFTSASGGRLIAIKDKVINYSDDGGDTWTSVEHSFFFNKIYYNGQGTLYSIGANKGVMTSTDGGENWAANGEGLFKPQFGAISGQFVSDSDGNIMLANQSEPSEHSGAAGLYVFNEGSGSWEAPEGNGLSSYSVRSLVKSDTEWYALLGHRLFTSPDEGQTWTELENRPPESFISMNVASNGDIFLGSTTSIYRSQDGGSSWEELPEGSDVTSIDIRAAKIFTTSENIVFTNYLGGLLRWDNESDSWTKVGSNLSGSVDRVWFNTHNEQLYVKDSELYTSSDNGDSWNQLESVSNLIDLAFESENTFYAIGATGLYKSEDGGSSWTEIQNNFNGRMFGNIGADKFTAAGELLLVNVTSSSSDDPETHPSGLYVSADEGGSWVLTGDNEIETGHITMLETIGGKFYTGTAGQGVFASEAGTGTASESEDEKVSSFTLEQNYPNPFNPTTQISFKLSEADFVSLKVYNMLGQEVSEIINSKMNAGYHSVELDASHLASGIYIYRLEFSGKVSSRKMTLLR